MVICWRFKVVLLGVLGLTQRRCKPVRGHVIALALARYRDNMG